MLKAVAEHCREMAIVDGGFVDIEAWSLDAVAAVAPMESRLTPQLSPFLPIMSITG